MVIVSKLVFKTLLPPIIGEKYSNENSKVNSLGERLENIDFSDDDIRIP